MASYEMFSWFLRYWEISATLKWLKWMYFKPCHIFNKLSWFLTARLQYNSCTKYGELHHLKISFENDMKKTEKINPHERNKCPTYKCIITNANCAITSM